VLPGNAQTQFEGVLVHVTFDYRTTKWQLIIAKLCIDDRKSLTTRGKSSTLEAARTFVLIRSATGWDRPRAPHTGITIRSRIGQRTPGAMLIVARRAQTTQVWNGLWGTTNRRFSFPYHRMAG
jgi:hypothetical protein